MLDPYVDNFSLVKIYFILHWQQNKKRFKKGNFFLTAGPLPPPPLNGAAITIFFFDWFRFLFLALQLNCGNIYLNEVEIIEFLWFIDNSYL